MYLVTLYFDDLTNQKLNSYIKLLSKHGNTSMKEIEPHLTIASFHDHLEEVTALVDSIKFLDLELTLTSFGFFPEVIYTQAVMSEELNESYLRLHHAFLFDGYRPYASLLHVTLIKHLTSQEFMNSIAALNHQKLIWKAKIKKVTITEQSKKEIVYKKE